jgi:hypothetical protein
VAHRAQFLRPFAQVHLPELEMTCREAVKCRNYYVHGDENPIDYEKYPRLKIFLTTTLEFVFCVSELVEAGWSFSSWHEKQRTLSNWYAEYIHDYPSDLNVLRQAQASRR